MNFAFLGTPLFAKRVLQGLIKRGWIPSAIVTQPEKEPAKQRSRGQTLGSDLATWARRSLVHIPLLQPQRASSEKSVVELKQFQPDVILVAAYGQLLRPNLLQLPPLGCLNAHTSLLPRWRGAAPVQRAILAGDLVTGLTLMKMVEELDAGEIIQQVPIKIEEMTRGQLEEVLAHHAAEQFSWALTELREGRDLQSVAQNDQLATLAPKFGKEEGYIDWSESALDTHRRIRAATPNPGAWCQINYRGRLKRLKLAESHLLASDEIVESGVDFDFGSSCLIAKLKDAPLGIGQVQLEGKRWVGAREFWSGYNRSQPDRSG